MNKLLISLFAMLFAITPVVHANQRAELAYQNSGCCAPQCACDPCECDPCAPVCGTQCGLCWPVLGMGVVAAAVIATVIATSNDRSSSSHS